MNLDQLKKTFGRIVKLWPVPQQERKTGTTLADQYNRWLLLPADSGILFKNAVTDHQLQLAAENIREFRTPDIVILRGQVLLTEGHQVVFEPFAPIPSDSSQLFVGQALLRLMINEQSDLVVLAASEGRGEGQPFRNQDCVVKSACSSHMSS